MLWITLEGPDGAGKSSLHRAICENLTDFYAGSFPTQRAKQQLALLAAVDKAAVGVEARRVDVFLADMDHEVSGTFSDCVFGALKQDVYLTDRGPLSTLAYAPRGIVYESALQTVTGRGLFVDVVFYLDTPPEVCVARQEVRGATSVDLGGFEGNLHGARRIRDLYNQAITDYVEACVEAGDPGPDVVVLDGTRPMDELVSICHAIIAKVRSRG